MVQSASIQFFRADGKSAPLIVEEWESQVTEVFTKKRYSPVR